MHRWMPMLLAMMLGGCVAPAGVDPAEIPGDWTAGREGRAVVGLVDSGVNPYHEAYRDDAAALPGDLVDARTGEPPVHLRLSTVGSFDERLTTDRALWAGVEKERLYWFVGTRVLAISFLASAEGPLLLADGHGHAVASTLRNVSAGAWIVVVQTNLGIVPLLNGEQDPLAPFEMAGRATQWLADQPWVDIVSLSIGVPGNPPFPPLSGLVEATRSASERGKVVVVAAGNEPSATVAAGTSGPPWVVSVGGVEPATHGDAKSARIVDVVSDHTRLVAAREPDEYQQIAGTSFSAPVVAANVAEAIRSLRHQAGHPGGMVGNVLCPCEGRNVTAADLREALNASAVYWNTLDYDPLNYSEDPVLLVAFVTLPILPAPWVQMGWGYVGEETWRVMVAALQGQPPEPKPAEAQAYMAAQHALREAYWAAAQGPGGAAQAI